MMPFTGADLCQVFSNVGINTGNVSNQTINSWFDTDCEDTKAFLNWICGNISSENVLTESELQEFEELKESNQLLSGEQYNAKLNELEEKYPGILEYEGNVLEVECLEDELAALLEEEKRLETALNVSRGVDKLLNRELTNKRDDETSLAIATKEAEEKCKTLSCQLDDHNRKLQQQISCYTETIKEYQDNTKPLFISSFPLNQYELHYLDVESQINMLLKRENRSCPPTVKSACKRLLHLTENDSSGEVDELEVLCERIFQSSHTYYCKQIEKSVLEAQIKFLKEIDWNAVSSNKSLEMYNILKSEFVDGLFVDLKNMCNKLAISIIDQPKLSFMLSTLEFKQMKFEGLTKINETLTKLITTVILLHLLTVVEADDVQSTRKFLNDVFQYTNKSQATEERIKSMNLITQNYQAYNNRALDEKLKLADILKEMFSSKNEYHSISAVDIINKLEDDCARLEQKVFLNDAEHQRQHFQLYEQNLKIIRHFLTNGPTSAIIVFPQQILTTINNIFNFVQSQEAELKVASQAFISQKNASLVKWSKMKRLLLMWFLFKPHKVHSAINEIAAEVTKARNETVSNSVVSISGIFNK